MRRRFASSSPRSIRLASLISSAELSRGTFPISLRYIRTGSSMLTPSSGSRGASDSSSSSARFSASLGSSTTLISRSTSIP